ncbi:MAG: hypothetical protein FWD73_08195 [Polyangiaceae bacterium]|nr:hypothetical protein [Polyangiaceae bacterium]
MSTDKGTFVDLVLNLPSGFTLDDDTRDEELSNFGTRSVEHFRSYNDAGGQRLLFFAWDGMPLHDRGPMVAAEKWKVRIDSVEANVSRTSLFFGRKQEVLVAHFKGPSPARRQYMIYTTRVDKAAFDALLAGIRFSPTD